MTFDQAAFNRFVVKQGVVGFFQEQITLKSGRKSHWYANWRVPTSDVHAMQDLSTYVLDFVQSLGLNPDCFYGVPEGATKLATVTQYRWGTERQLDPGRSFPLAMGRGRPKEHGKAEDRFFLGLPRGRTVVLEDVTTTGGSLIKTLDALAEADVDVIATIGLTNRMEQGIDDPRGIAEILHEERDIPHHSMSRAHELLPLAYQRLKPGKDIARAVEAEFKDHGLEPLKLLEEE